jgi:hypothetical protein
MHQAEIGPRASVAVQDRVEAAALKPARAADFCHTMFRGTAAAPAAFFALGVSNLMR